MSYTDRSAHANKAKSCRYFRQYRNPDQEASGKNGTYGHPITTTLTILLQKIYCISHTTDSTWVENEIICGCARTCLRMSKGVFRSLACKHQTTDSSNLLSCCPCSSEFWLFCSKSWICFGEMYWSESIHFN